MSLDLVLIDPRGQASPGRQRLVAALMSLDHVSIEGDEALYEHPDTGVLVAFAWDPETLASAGPGAVGMAFLAMPRAAAYLLEAEPVLRRVLDLTQLELAHADPAHTSDPNDPEAQRAVWRRLNVSALADLMAETGSLPDGWLRLPRALRTAAWAWNHRRADAAAASGLFTPPISWLADIDKAIPVAIWPDALPALIPETEVVVLERTSGNEPGATAVGWMELEKWMDHCERVEGPWPARRMTSPPGSLCDAFAGFRPATLPEQVGPEQVLDTETVAEAMGLL